MMKFTRAVLVSAAAMLMPLLWQEEGVHAASIRATAAQQQEQQDHRQLPHKQSCNPLVANIGNGVVSGTVKFSCPDYPSPYTVVEYDLEGLTEGLHGLHVHESSVTEPGNCGSTLGHWNPAKVNHGTNLDQQRHIGDLGNIQADADGKAVGTLMAYVPLYGYYGIKGRAVVVHAGQDDEGRGGNDGSRAVGNAGARPGCGDIKPYES